VVIEENVKSENDPSEIIMNHSDAILYKGSSFEYPVDNVSYHHKKDVLQYSKVVEFYHNYYKPENIVFSIVSDLSFERILRMLKNTDFNRKKKPALQPTYIESPRLFSLSTIQNMEIDIVKKKGIENILITIGFRVCGSSNNDKYILEFVKYLLSNTTTSRLYLDLREKRGLVYGSNIYTEYYDEIGDFTIFTQTDKDKIIRDKSSSRKGLIPSLVLILNDLVRNGITEKELHTIKGYLKGSSIMSIEDINEQCEYNGVEEIMKSKYKEQEDTVSILDIYDRFYKKITISEINKTIRKYFTSSNMVICLLGETVPSRDLVKREFAKFIG
jgi:predicted Zn-dependent peptidase